MEVCESTTAEQDALDSQLVAFNRSNVPFQQSKDWISLSHVVKDSAGVVVAGINATLYCWKIMYVDVLYVQDDQRGKGYGKLLLEQAEHKARGLDGYLSHLDTFDWQARDFYATLGYSVFGVLADCPPGHSRYYMQKRL